MTKRAMAEAKLKSLSGNYPEEEIRKLLEEEIQIDKLVLELLAKTELLKEKSGLNHKNSFPENARKKAVVEEIHAYLTEHFTEPFRADELASRFHISRSYMMHAFKDKYYLSINEYLILLRISQSKRMLHLTHATVTEISDQCGFNTLSYFVKIFREKEGLTPTEYREQCRKNIIMTDDTSAPFRYEGREKMAPVMKIHLKENL